MTHERHMSDPGRRELEAREGKRNQAYPDPATGGAPWTIGYGQTGPGIHPGLVWSDEQCDDALSKSLATVYEPAINSDVTVELEQREFDALGSFVYNIGTGAFARSTLLKKLNAGDKEGAAEEFMHWVIPAMITERRRSEMNEFLGHEDTPFVPRASEAQVNARLVSVLRVRDVHDFQRGHSLSPDGVIGPKTQRAMVLAVQNAKGLLADGIVGPATLSALGL